MLIKPAAVPAVVEDGPLQWNVPQCHGPLVRSTVQVVCLILPFHIIEIGSHLATNYANTLFPRTKFTELPLSLAS